MKILFVCSGNTCRSPMAAAIAKREVAEHGYTFEIDSAGTCQTEDAACPNAIEVAHENGCDLSKHIPKQLDERLLAKDAYIFVMENGQIRDVRDIGKHPCVKTLGEKVEDPYGGDLEKYRTTWKKLERLIRDRLAGLS